MTHSVSSASSLDGHAPSESGGQSHGTRWEEQQKVLALEQLCGVFRVDLGHMRSLRLFFRSAGSLERSRGAYNRSPWEVLLFVGFRMVCFMITSGKLVVGMIRKKANKKCFLVLYKFLKISKVGMVLWILFSSAVAVMRHVPVASWW